MKSRFIYHFASLNKAYIKNELNKNNVLSYIHDVVSRDTNLTADEKIVIEWRLMFLSPIRLKEQLKQFTVDNQNTIAASQFAYVLPEALYSLQEKELAYAAGERYKNYTIKLMSAIDLGKSE